MSFINTQIIFRRLKQDDIHRLYAIYSDKEAMKYRGSQPMETLEDAKSFVDNQQLLKGKILTIRKGVALEDTKELIGSVMYRFDENKKSECEIGYSISSQYWGRGLGKEIIKQLLISLKQQHIKDVIAWSNNKNIASIKILEYNGFQRIEHQANTDYCLYHQSLLSTSQKS